MVPQALHRHNHGALHEVREDLPLEHAWTSCCNACQWLRLLHRFGGWGCRKQRIVAGCAKKASTVQIFCRRCYVPSSPRINFPSSCGDTQTSMCKSIPANHYHEASNKQDNSNGQSDRNDLVRLEARLPNSQSAIPTTSHALACRMLTSSRRQSKEGMTWADGAAADVKTSCVILYPKSMKLHSKHSGHQQLNKQLQVDFSRTGQGQKVI